MTHFAIQEFRPIQTKKILYNRGCGISYLQRNHKIPYSKIPADSWFFREKLCDKIAVDVPWSVLEPREGEFDWNNPEWEGCFSSWMEHGYKVHLKVRGMSTLGTFYNDGTPQWVFDAGARYIDEPVDFYRNHWMLNDIPCDGQAPIRYPVYWDPVYLDKTDALIAELGKRYDNHPAVESVSIAHVGRWGEMHVADHYRPERWVDAGFAPETYNRALIRIIGSYRRAFPHTQLSLSLGRPLWLEGICLEHVLPAIEYATSQGVMLKHDGLGHSWEFGAGPYLCKSVADTMRLFAGTNKLMMENLVLPNALESALRLGISYWQPGGEPPGMASVLNVEKEIPLPEKRIYSFYTFFREQYDRMTIEDEKNLWRNMAKNCGYRMVPSEVRAEFLPGSERWLRLDILWWNLGSAACFEAFDLAIRLIGSDGLIWCAQQRSTACNALPIRREYADASVWRLPDDCPTGNCELQLGIVLPHWQNSMMELGIEGRNTDGFYPLGKINIKTCTQMVTTNQMAW